MRTSRWRSGSGLVGLLAAVALAGCGVGSSKSSVGMMGDHFAPLSCAGPSTQPTDSGTRVTITLTDLGMMQRMGGTAPMGARMTLRVAPARVAAGSLTLAAVNLGWRTHELVVLPLAADASVGQRVPGADGRIDETGSVTEASASCAGGTGDGIASGSIGWTTATLPAGRYELVCNLANHYADGMYAELVVG